MFNFGLLLLAGVTMGHPYGVYNNYNQHGVPAYNHGGYGYGAPVVQQQQGYFGAGFNPSQQAQFSPYHHQFSKDHAGSNFFKQGANLARQSSNKIKYILVQFVFIIFILNIVLQ